MKIQFTIKKRLGKRFSLLRDFGLSFKRDRREALAKRFGSWFKRTKAGEKYNEIIETRLVNKEAQEQSRRPAKTFTEKVARFFVEAYHVGKNQFIEFFKTLYFYSEMVVILIAASIGANFMLSEIPFLIALPMWVETTMFFPVLSVLLISLLLYIAAKRDESQTRNKAITLIY